MKFRVAGDKELCSDHIKFERSICYPHGGVKKAVGYESQNQLRGWSRDRDSGNIVLNWYLNYGVELGHQRGE